MPTPAVRSHRPVTWLAPIALLALACGQSSPSGPADAGANTPPTLTITSPADGASLSEGPVTLIGSASDAEDGDVSASISWTSGGTAVGTGSTVVATLSAGSVSITATVSDRDGASASASISITLIATEDGPPQLSITTPDDSTSVVDGTPVPFVAGATDVEDGDVSSQIQWTSDRDGPLGMGASLTRTLSLGGHTVTASVEDSGGNSVSDSVHVDVVAAHGGTAANVIVVANEGSDDLTVIDVDGDSVLTTIPLVASPTDVALSPDGQKAIAPLLAYPAQVAVADLATGTFDAPLSNDGLGIFVSPDGETGYLCCGGVPPDFGGVGASLAAIDLNVPAVVGTILLPGGASYEVVFDPTREIAYNAKPGGGLNVIDTGTRTVVDSIDTPDGILLAATISPDGQTGYFALNTPGFTPGTRVIVLNFADGSVSDSIAVNPNDMVFPAGGTTLFASALGVVVIDASTNTIETTIGPLDDDLSWGEMALSADGATLYATRRIFDSVTAEEVAGEVVEIDVATRTIIGSVPVGVGPIAIAIADGN